MRSSAGLAQRLLRLERAASPPGPRQLENMRLRQRIREEFVRSRQTYGSPRLAHVLGLPGTAQPHRATHAPGAALCTAALQVSSGDHGQSARRSDRSEPIAQLSCCNSLTKSGSPMRPASSPVKAGSTSSRSGCLYPAHRRLGDEPNPRHASGHRRPADGHRPTSPRPALSSTPIAELSSPAPRIANSSPITASSLR